MARGGLGGRLERQREQRRARQQERLRNWTIAEYMRGQDMSAAAARRAVLVAERSLLPRRHLVRPDPDGRAGLVDIEPLLRACAVAEGLDPEDVVAEARRVLAEWEEAGLLGAWSA